MDLLGLRNKVTKQVEVARWMYNGMLHIKYKGCTSYGGIYYFTTYQYPKPVKNTMRN